MASDFEQFLFGSNDGEKNRRNQYDRLSNRDNRMSDFGNYAGSALNNLANRGVINSTVGANAMSNALTQAEKNFWDDQYKLLMGYDYNADNSDGLLPSLLSGVGGAFSGAAGKAIGAGLF